MVRLNGLVISRRKLAKSSAISAPTTDSRRKSQAIVLGGRSIACSATDDKIPSDGYSTPAITVTPSPRAGAASHEG